MSFLQKLLLALSETGAYLATTSKNPTVTLASTLAAIFFSAFSTVGGGPAAPGATALHAQAKTPVS
jgi:hypothetical protein